MKKSAPNKVIAPICIAGITVGFLAIAYAFVFAKPKEKVDLSSHFNESQSDQAIEELEKKHSKSF